MTSVPAEPENSTLPVPEISRSSVCRAEEVPAASAENVAEKPRLCPETEPSDASERISSVPAVAATVLRNVIIFTATPFAVCPVKSPTFVSTSVPLSVPTFSEPSFFKSWS